MDLFDMINEEFGQPKSKYGTPKKTRMGRRQFTGDADPGGLGQHMATPQDKYKAARRRARGKARSFTDPSHRRARGVKKVTAGTDYKELFGPAVKNIIESSEAYLKHKKERSLARLAARGKEIASAGGDPDAGVGGSQQSRGTEKVLAKDLRTVTRPRRGHRPRGTGGNWPPVRGVTSSGRHMPRDISP